MTLLCKLHDFVAAFSDFPLLPLVHPELFKRIQQGSEDFGIIAYKLVPHNGEGPLNLILPDCLPAAFGVIQNMLAAAPLDIFIGLADVDFLSSKRTAAFAAEDLPLKAYRLWYFSGSSIPICFLRYSRISLTASACSCEIMGSWLSSTRYCGS
jgi:hypothetical protein